MTPSRLLALFPICVMTMWHSELLRAGQPTDSSPLGLGAKTWVGRHAEVEDYLRTAECVRVEDFGPAVKRCTLPPGGLVARMVWKAVPPGIYRGFRESYKAEIAAYEVDKLLKLDMVPPTVEREFEGKKGAAIMWVENAAGWKETSPSGSGRAHWENQLVQMAMFDDLIGNKDRNRNNVLQDAAWNAILLDHVRAFSSSADLPYSLNRIDEDFWVRIERLTRNHLDAVLRTWLDESEIRAILDRREKMRVQVVRLRGR